MDSLEWFKKIRATVGDDLYYVIKSKMQIEQYSVNEILTKIGDKGNKFFVILKGQVGVFVKNEDQLTMINVLWIFTDIYQKIKKQQMMLYVQIKHIFQLKLQKYFNISLIQLKQHGCKDNLFIQKYQLNWSKYGLQIKCKEQVQFLHFLCEKIKSWLPSYISLQLFLKNLFKTFI